MLPPLQFESGALLLYIADKYGNASTPEARARAAQWVIFASSTLASAVFVDQTRWVLSRGVDVRIQIALPTISRLLHDAWLLLRCFISLGAAVLLFLYICSS